MATIGGSITVKPSRLAIKAGETINAYGTTMYGIAVYHNGTKLGNMTYVGTNRETGEDIYRYILPDTGLTVGDAITVQLGASTLQSYTVVETIVNPTITAMEVVRCLADGTESDEGTYLLIKSLKISANAKAASLTASEITVGTVTLALDSTVLEAALSSAGYSESSISGSVFEGETFSNGASYSGQLTIGTAYESATQAFTVARAFANMHLSGASTGGVAFGSFSSSTEGNPLFESRYPAIFYEGIEGVTNYAAAETLTGGKWTNDKPIYRQIFTLTTTATGLQTLGTISGLDAVIKIEGTCKSSSNWLPIVYAFTSSGGSTTQARAYVSLTGEVSASFSGSGSKTFTVIVYYTKQ